VAVLDPAQGVDDLVEPEAPIDRGLQLTGGHQLLDPHEVRAVEGLPPQHQAHPMTSCPADDRRGDQLEECRIVPAQGDVRAAGAQRAANRERALV
jgi:hypothetical protein